MRHSISIAWCNIRALVFCVQGRGNIIPGICWEGKNETVTSLVKKKSVIHQNDVGKMVKYGGKPATSVAVRCGFACSYSFPLNERRSWE